MHFLKTNIQLSINLVHFIIILLSFHLAKELFMLCIFNSRFVRIPLLLFPPSPPLRGAHVFY